MVREIASAGVCGLPVPRSWFGEMFADASAGRKQSLLDSAEEARERKAALIVANWQSVRTTGVAIADGGAVGAEASRGANGHDEVGWPKGSAAGIRADGGGGDAHVVDAVARVVAGLARRRLKPGRHAKRGDGAFRG